MAFFNVVDKGLGLFQKKDKGPDTAFLSPAALQERYNAWLGGRWTPTTRGYLNPMFQRHLAEKGNPPHGAGFSWKKPTAVSRILGGSGSGSSGGGAQVAGMSLPLVGGILAAIIAAIYFIFKPKKRRRR